MGPETNECCTYESKEQRILGAEKQRKDHVQTEAEIKIKCQQPKGAKD